MRKLDVFNHFFPDPFFKKMMQVAGAHKDMGKRVRNVPMLTDLDARFGFFAGAKATSLAIARCPHLVILVLPLRVNGSDSGPYAVVASTRPETL